MYYLDVLDAVRGCMGKNGISWDDMEDIGMGVPGPVGDDGTVFGCVNLGYARPGCPTM